MACDGNCCPWWSYCSDRYADDEDEDEDIAVAQYELELMWEERPPGGLQKDRRLVLPVLNLSSTKNNYGDRFEITVEGTQDVLDLTIHAYLLSLSTPRAVLAKLLTCMLVSSTVQRTISGASNVILIFEDARGYRAVTGTTFGDMGREMPKPPKFNSIEEADAWMEQHEERATGALDRVLGKRGNR